MSEIDGLNSDGNYYSFPRQNNNHELKKKSTILLNITAQPELFILDKYSSFTELIKVIMSYILRFAHNIKIRKSKDINYSQNELKLGPVW